MTALQCSQPRARWMRLGTIAVFYAVSMRVASMTTREPDSARIE